MGCWQKGLEGLAIQAGRLPCPVSSSRVPRRRPMSRVPRRRPVSRVPCPASLSRVFQHWQCAGSGASTGDALALALAMRWLWRWRCTGTAGGQLEWPAPQSLFAALPCAGFPPLRGPNQRLTALAWPWQNIFTAVGHTSGGKGSCSSQSLTCGSSSSHWKQTGFRSRLFSQAASPESLSSLAAAKAPPFSAVCPFHNSERLSRARATPPCSPGPFASLRAAACARTLDSLSELLSCCSSW